MNAAVAIAAAFVVGWLARNAWSAATELLTLYREEMSKSEH